MKALKIFVAALYVILLFFIGAMWEHFRTHPENNEYQLVIYQTKFVLKDGKRIVGEIPVTSDHVLDSMILKDNQ